MNLRDLEYLVALAEHRHFHRAAEVCHVSQPTLSAQIRKIERELGFDLFERAPRNLLLTEDGARVLAHVQAALAEIGQIRAIAEERQQGARTRLRLGVFPTLGPYLLPRMVPEFIARFPAVELILKEAKSSLLVRDLIEGRIDAALLALPVDDPHLVGEEVFFEPFLLAVPSHHAFARRSSVSCEALAGQSLMLLEDGHCLRDQAMNLCRLWGAREMDGFRATSLETLRQMVVAGVGITLLPALAGDDAAGTAMVQIGDGKIGRRIGLFWRKSSNRGALFDGVAMLSREIAQSVLTRTP